MTGLHFWSTGYCVSTVGLDEGRIREYIREQEQLEAGQGTWTSSNVIEPAPEGPSPRERPLRGAFPNPRPLGVVD